jgi:pimeloyl-ACP methyl ester carboxylesterase
VVIPILTSSYACRVLLTHLRSYNELFTSQIFNRQIFVDQAPLQNYLSDWGPAFGNRGCNSPAALAQMQQTLETDPAIAHRGTIAACLGYRSYPLPGDPIADSQTWRDDEAFFLAEAMKGDGWWLGKLMADHTANDWRNSIAHTLGPESQNGQNETKVLVVASERSGCFPAAGPLKVVELINGDSEEGRARGVAIEWGGHWCYWEEPERFNNLVLGFLGDPE